MSEKASTTEARTQPLVVVPQTIRLSASNRLRKLASGCVRASVVDAFSDNYRVTVVEEGCFDRAQASHALSLCDMHAKYADVVKLDEVVGFIGTLPKGLFELPKAGEQAASKAA